MTHRITTFALAFALGGLLIVLTVLVGATSARALVATGHGVGYTSSTGWYLGTYVLDDGSRGFCLQAGRPGPVGHESDYVEGDSLGWFTPEQAAQLAYISRVWAGTDDRLTAGAGQVATWMVSGLNGQAPDFYAARAEADAGAVLARAHEMVAEAAREGSRGVTAAIAVDVGAPGEATVTVDLTVDKLSGPMQLPGSTHTGRLELVGATFADGADVTDAPNGVAIPITPTGLEPTISVAAAAGFTSLPYGGRIRVAVARDDAQALLIAVPATAAAQDEDSRTAVSPLPFQPTVRTVTSHAEVRPGDTITDHLTVDVARGDGLLPHWGVRTAEDTTAPVEAIVESSLLGPFPGEIVPAPAPPADAPVVCTVEVTVDGPGDYETPGCVLPEPGNYVWVERIDPSRIADELGGSRMLPWQSTFGVASEITRAMAPETPAPPAAQPPIERLATTGSGSGGGLLAGAGALGLGSALVGLSALRRSRRPAAHRGSRATSTVRG